MSKPNILIIHTDQHRLDCLGAYGNPDVLTPFLDGLAEDGVLYRNHYAPFPVCTPSRYSLLTGLYVHQHMGWDNHCTLPSSLPTFPQILKEDGYRTKAVGKMHFTPTYLDVGFDEMLLAEQDGPGRLDDDYHRYLMAKGLVDINDLEDQVPIFRTRAPEKFWKTFGAMKSNLHEKDHSTTWIGERAIEDLETWTDGGNMMMVGFIKPHHPFDPPEPWASMYEPDSLSLLDGWIQEPLSRDLAFHGGYFDHRELSEGALRHVMANYYGAISQIDHQVGRMVSCLKDKDLYDKTMIVFTSDHGEYMGYHHMLLKQNHMSEPLMTVPLIIKYPHQFSSGRENEGLFSIVDLTTTILAQASCVPDSFLMGIDMTNDPRGRDYVFAESGHGQGYMVRSRGGKLLVGKNPQDTMFFDLKLDPCEMTNLAGEKSYEEEVTRLKETLNRWLMFDAVTQIYLDEAADTIDQANIPINDKNREVVLTYCREKMLKG